MLDFVVRSLVIGIGACAAIDLWALLVSKVLKTPPPNFTMMGRWFLHLVSGRPSHESIAASPPMPNEGPVGWIFHYAVAVLFAAVTILIGGAGWSQAPTLWPAMLVGWATVALGWFWLQPSMGLGWAASKTPNPPRTRVLGILSHTVFGLAMYAVARLIA